MWTDALGPNIPNYRNEEVNQLFEAARLETDFDARMAPRADRSDPVEELPTLPLYRNTEPAVLSSCFNIDDAAGYFAGTNFRHPSASQSE